VIGQTVGNYEITGTLGEGGMGIVFSAVHRQLNRRVAVKVLLPHFSENQEVVTRFFNEARAAGAIDHPGIVNVLDCGYDHTGRAYIAMDYLDGETLTKRLARFGRMPADHVAAIGRMMAEALAAAHARGIIHRDLKPDNAMIVWDGQWERLKLLDFGLAKLQGDLASPDLRTRTGTFMGTPTYMSPEQCLGAANVDARSDVYSLGCVLYELICGRPPFEGEEFGRIVAAHLNTVPTPPAQIEPATPARLERLVMRLLEKNPDDRYQTMSQVASAFVAISAQQTLPPLADGQSRPQTGPMQPLHGHGSSPQQHGHGSSPQQHGYGSSPQGPYQQQRPEQHAELPRAPGSRPPPRPRRRNIGPTPIPELPKKQNLWLPMAVLIAVTAGLVIALIALLQ
jgi:serine/threonine-protein kinase